MSCKAARRASSRSREDWDVACDQVGSINLFTKRCLVFGCNCEVNALADSRVRARWRQLRIERTLSELRFRSQVKTGRTLSALHEVDRSCAEFRYESPHIISRVTVNIPSRRSTLTKVSPFKLNRRPPRMYSVYHVMRVNSKSAESEQVRDPIVSA